MIFPLTEIGRSIQKKKKNIEKSVTSNEGINLDLFPRWILTPATF